MLASVAFVPVVLCVVVFLAVWLGAFVGVILAFVGRGRVPGPWTFAIQVVRLAYRRDAA